MSNLSISVALRSLPGLANSPKKRWKDPPFEKWVNPHKSTFSMGHFPVRYVSYYQRVHEIEKGTHSKISWRVSIISTEEFDWHLERSC